MTLTIHNYFPGIMILCFWPIAIHKKNTNNTSMEDNTWIELYSTILTATYCVYHRSREDTHTDGTNIRTNDYKNATNKNALS